MLYFYELDIHLGLVSIFHVKLTYVRYSQHIKGSETSFYVCKIHTKVPILKEVTSEKMQLCRVEHLLNTC